MAGPAIAIGMKVETQEGEGSAFYYFSSDPPIFFELCDQIKPNGK